MIKNLRTICIAKVKNLTIGKEYLSTYDIKNNVFWLIDDFGYRESYDVFFLKSKTNYIFSIKMIVDTGI
jgi:hypothetical protein